MRNKKLPRLFSIHFNRLVLSTICFLLLFFPARAITQKQAKPGPSQKVIIIMMDGFGIDYYRKSNMPNLNKIEKRGIYKPVISLMPSVTNLNNTSICTGSLPIVHGITGNSFVNPATGNEEFMEEDSLVLAPTIFERAQKKGVHSLLFSSKKKTTGLLFKGTDEGISPETASKKWIDLMGAPPSIYSREVNYWLLNAAIYSMQHNPAIDLFYIHTTDYPMHTWAPEEKESKEHLHALDSLIGRMMEVLPNAVILLTADHHVNHKNFCWDIEKALAKRNISIKMAISPERDKYFKHHRGFGGTSYVYLKDSSDRARVIQGIKQLKGVDEVITRQEAVKRFHLMPTRIGDLVVLGDSTTVFGDLDTENEVLPANYRSHGSLYEAKVPLFMYNTPPAIKPSAVKYNYQIAKWLYN